ncbi:MAG: bifunctional diguanylate cyclase/phosphodiesterase [Rhodanobacteraceae bacterium]
MLTLELVLTATQFIGALIIAALLLYYDRVSPRRSLPLWAGSFLAGAIYLATAWGAMQLALHSQSEVWSRLPLSTISMVAAYWQLAMAVMATRIALHAGTLAPKRIRLVLWVTAILGVIVAIAWAGHPDAWLQRVLMRVGLRYMLGAICFAYIALDLWRSVPRDGLGTRIAGSAMAIYSLQLLHVSAIYAWQIYTGQGLEWSRYTGIIDLVSMLFMGFGLIVWLLEEERNRAQRADAAMRRIRDFDPVTGFPNRRRLLNDLPQWLRQTNQQTAILMLRLDQQETLSGTIGIVALESIMAETASRFEQHARSGWHRPARLSETRLVQVIPRADNTAHLTAFANDLLTTMRLPFYTDGQEFSLSASIGIALAPEDGETAEALIAAAESACKSAHDEGGNRFHYFSSELNTIALTKLGLQSELRQAMLRGELELYYQPLVSGDNHHLCGAEGLVRWNHPQRGTLLPEMFITEMDQLGLSEELDRMMIRQACREACIWRDRYGSEISISINVSTRSFQFAGFPDQVRGILNETGLEPARLELEIVESGALVDPSRAIQTLSQLRQLGVRSTLDDFGTGYSSLTHLRELPVDCLKIDRSFVDNVMTSKRDAAIVAATITLAHSLGLEVVVEGIETQQQLEWFKQHDADRLQGFLFSAPIKSGEMHKLLQSRDQWLATIND